jgi:Rrf2 family protein
MRPRGRDDPEREVVPRLVGEQERACSLEERVRTGDLLDLHRPILRGAASVLVAGWIVKKSSRPGYGSAVRVSAKVDYALRAMLELAAAGTLVKGEHLSTAQAIPRKFLESILVQLRNEELVASQRGVEGGYALARPAEEISVADVIRAVEGPIATVRGARPEDVEYVGAAAGLQPVWLDLRTAMRDVLEQTTLADIVARSTAPRGGPST